MKRLIALCLVTIIFGSLLCGCVKVPTSKDAKDKMEQAGYVVTLSRFSESGAQNYEDNQIILLNAEKDGDTVLQAYFFRNKQDADRFFEEKHSSLRTNVEAFHKFGYVICRGTASAVEDFLK